MNDTLTKVKKFFVDNPERVEGVERANLAYFANHRSAGAHYFSGSSKESTCRWCDQTREGVRWDWYNSPPTCQQRPKWANESIGGVIAYEERLFEKVINRAILIACGLDMLTLTGKELSQLHHTYGVDPSMLDAALSKLGKPSLSQKLHDEYLEVYSLHRATGLQGLVRTVLKAKTS